jgi:hypothetical protein
VWDQIHQYVWANDGKFPYNGRQEEFGVGGDGIVYHAWQRYPGDPDWDGWWPMGGHDVFWGGDGPTYDNPPTIRVVGGDRLTYCTYWQWWKEPADWSYWYQCN